MLEPITQTQRVTADLVDVVHIDRSRQIQLVADLGAAGDRDLVVEAIATLGDTGAGAGLEALKLAVENEVDHAAHSVSAVLCRGTAGDDVDVLDEALGQHTDVDSAAAVIRHDTGTVEQHQRALAAQTTQVHIAAAGIAEQRARTALRGFGLEQLRQLVELVGQRGAGVVLLKVGGDD